MTSSELVFTETSLEKIALKDNCKHYVNTEKLPLNQEILDKLGINIGKVQELLDNVANEYLNNSVSINNDNHLNKNIQLKIDNLKKTIRIEDEKFLSILNEKKTKNIEKTLKKEIFIWYKENKKEINEIFNGCVNIFHNSKISFSDYQNMYNQFVEYLFFQRN